MLSAGCSQLWCFALKNKKGEKEQEVCNCMQSLQFGFADGSWSDFGCLPKDWQRQNICAIIIVRSKLVYYGGFTSTGS